MRFPDFIPAKRGAAPNLTQAAIYQGMGDREEYESKLAERQAKLRGPVDAYKGYVDLTDHNPLADQVRKWRGKEPSLETHVPAAGSVGKDAAETAMNMPGGSAGMQTSNLVASLGGGAGMNAGSNAGINSLSMTNPGAAGQQMSTMLPATTEVAGKAGSAAAGAAGGAITGGALSGLMESQNPYTNDQRIAVKSAGGASTGTLMATAAPLAAAGPVGWAAIAGLAAMSLYGMLV